MTTSYFSADYIYMYKDYISRADGGQRLQAIGMTQASDAGLDSGFKELVSRVEANHSRFFEAYIQNWVSGRR